MSTPLRLYLVHHADAMSPGADPQRPLSALGHQQAAALAARAKAAGVRPAAIWHSGKLRARQTAEPFLIASPFADFKMVRGLSPEDAPELMRETLLHETRALMLVGHMPNIAALLQLLAPGSVTFPMHGLVALERAPDARVWTELSRDTGR